METHKTAARGTATETETETATGVLTDTERRETDCSKQNLIEITYRGHSTPKCIAINAFCPVQFVSDADGGRSMTGRSSAGEVQQGKLLSVWFIVKQSSSEVYGPTETSLNSILSA